MPDWRSPESIPDKRKMLEAAFGSDAPMYMFFDLGDMKAGFAWNVDEAVRELVKKIFFEGQEPNFGAIEAHSSHGYTGLGMTRPDHRAQPFGVLRVRGSKHVEYMIEIAGRACHMVEFCDDRGFDANGGRTWESKYGKDGHSPLSVNFLQHWGDPSGPLPQQTLVGV